ncbi:MAG: L-serine ammonia-lyase [Mycobacterium sp.]
MTVSVFDLFSIGIGPSSSHTVGPMRAAARFVAEISADGALDKARAVHVDLYGSLGATGAGHGTVGAVVLGLAGADPETLDPVAGRARLEEIARSGLLQLAGMHPVAFDAKSDVALLLHTLDFHSNGMQFEAFGPDGESLHKRVYFSVGGGFILDENEAAHPPADDVVLPHRFTTSAQLVAEAERHQCTIAQLMTRNEAALARTPDLREGVLQIWHAMQACVDAGLRARGTLPGALRVKRRAGLLAESLKTTPDDPLHAVDWLTVYALAVNEENAAGGRVVTAPTNGAAGVIPAVLHYYRRFIPGADDDGVVEFLLTATAIGILFKTNASISGAEVGCQGEVGSACSMAAAGLAAVSGGTPAQIENAAEIGIEHNLGLTCDPVGGLVQIPCIERNAVAAVKAVTAARIALRGDGTHHVSLDTAIKTMRETGADMQDKYKETSRGGLALNVVEC